MLTWERDHRMAPLKLQDFLYGLEWGEKVDTLFAEVLSNQAAMGNFCTTGGDNTGAIKEAQYVINMAFKKAFSLKVCRRQTKKLKKMCDVFSWLLSLDGFHYDEITNRTHAIREVWRSITEIEVFAHAYEMYGDLCWEYLKIIYGAPPNVVPQPISLSIHRDVINISSDDEDTGMYQKSIAPFNDVIHVDSSYNNTHGTAYWNIVARYVDNTSDYETSPSVNTEASTSKQSIGTSSQNNNWLPWK